jgi:hypothetical protein
MKKKATAPQNHDPLLDFRNFLFLIWEHLQLPAPTPLQYDIASYLQHGPRRKVIEAFRGIGKSWITAAYVLWRLYCDPQSNILVVSASKSRADNFTTFCLQLINEIEFLRHLIPRSEQRCSKIEFDVAPAEADQNPSVKSAGITGQITGSRADEIVADDVEVPNNSETQLMREKLRNQIREFDAILKPGGRVTYLGTPQCEESIYNSLPQAGYTIRVWPARGPSPKWVEIHGDKLAPMLVGWPEGEPTEPSRFHDQDLVERAASYGRSGFALQFMLDTQLSDADRYPLKLKDLIILPLDREQAAERYAWAAVPERVINDLPNVGLGGDRFYRPMPLPQIDYLPYESKVMSVDPSGRGKDETGYAIGGTLHGIIHLLDAGGFHDGSSAQTLLALAHLALRYKVNRIIVEANFGDGMYTKLLQPVVSKVFQEAGLPGCTCEEVKHSRQKELRIIDTLEPVIASHRLVVDQELVRRDYESVKGLPEEVAGKYRLMYQLTHITKDRGSLLQDDRLDALSMMVAHYTQLMAVDTQKAVARSRDKAMAAELARFAEHVVGSRFGKRGGLHRLRTRPGRL